MGEESDAGVQEGGEEEGGNRKRTGDAYREFRVKTVVWELALLPVGVFERKKGACLVRCASVAFVFE